MTSLSLLQAAIEFGLLVGVIEQDEKIHRVGTQSKPKSKNGWYVAFDNFLIMGDWQTSLTSWYKPDELHRTKQDLKRIKEQIKRQRLEKSRLNRQAAKQAEDIYLHSSQALYHPYLNEKRLDSAEGLKHRRNELVVPLYNLENGKVENLQRIFPNGAKRFLKNARLTGLCCPCGLLNSQSEWQDPLTKIFVCEGYATAASIYQVTQQPVLAAMNAGNLLSVAKLAQTKWPNIEITIAGDDDWVTEQETGINPGKAKATEAASQVNGKLSFPPFTLEHKRAGLTDWNDYYSMMKGREA